MNERFTPQNEQPNKSEQARLESNYRVFEDLKRELDIRGGGAVWYRGLFNHGINYAKVFNYLTVIPAHDREFRDGIYHVVELQLRFQRQLQTLQQRADEQNRTLDIPGKELHALTEAARSLKKMQDRYLRGRSNSQKQISEFELQKQAREAEKVFVDLWEKAQKVGEIPWPYDEIVEEQKTETKLQSENGGPQRPTEASPGSSDAAPEGEKEPSQEQSGGGGDNGGGGDDTGAGEEPKSEREPFEFHPEMLRTVSGRARVFREMVRMYNDVRQKRDALGFGEERDAEGNLVHKAYRNVKNVDFDGFLSFRRRYSMLKERIVEYTNRSTQRDAEGKITETAIEIELTPKEVEDFAKGFSFLTAYYGRAERFGQPDTNNNTQESSAAQEASEPSAEADAPDMQHAPEPEPSSHHEQAAEPESEAASGGQPEPESEPEAHNQTHAEHGPAEEKEGKAYEQRLEIRNAWRVKKEAFESAYDAFLTQEERRKSTLGGKLSFWKKPQQPQALQDAEREYQEARAAYARSLDSALGQRITGISLSLKGNERPQEEKIPALRAALANRFVLGAAHDKLRIEKEYLPTDSRSLRVFEDLQKSLKKHRTFIRAGGYAMVTGIGLVSGGIAAAVIALAGKELQTKVSAAFIAGGATVGAAVGNSISENIIAYQGRRRDSAMQKAQRSFSVESLQALEDAYLEGYRGHEKAVRSKKLVVGAGALAGGVLGAAIAGNLDELTDMPELPIEPEPTEPEEPVIVVPDEPEEPSAPEVEEEPAPEEPEPEPEEPAPIPEPEEPVPEPIPDEPERPDEIMDDPIQDEPAVEEIEEPEKEDQDTPEVPELLHTFESGSRVDTVSEALFESWKDDPELVQSDFTKKEFLAEMYTAIAEIEKDPGLNADLMEQMGITSGDIDKVQVGQTINLQPFFEYLNNK